MDYDDGDDTSEKRLRMREYQSVLVWNARNLRVYKQKSSVHFCGTKILY
jgi:hypothetical protein